MRRTSRAVLGVGLLVGALESIGAASAAVTPPPSGASTAASTDPVRGGGAHPEEVALEGRLLAPCCYQQTLDIHDSPLSTELRGEIRLRLGSGESAEAIEADLVRRYGERIRALPTATALNVSMLGAAALGLAAAVALGLTLRRWMRRANATAGEPQAAQAPRDAYDDRLDDALAELDRSG